MNANVLTPDTLNEKLPIIIQNFNGDEQQLISSALKYMYIYTQKDIQKSSDKPIINTSKYLFISTDVPTEIEIINPKFDKENYKSVSIKMKPDNILILPIFWMYKCDKDLECVYVHDIFSVLYQNIYFVFTK
jgi:hypothetical protein